MYTLHIANKNYSSWSLRPWVLLRALETELASAGTVTVDLRAVSPAPTL
ncbi:MAG: hypothetical protein U1A72_04395 [Sulfuritalea sp.]|nr:hypothetical protein [Sulfuritalea sp.]